MHLDNAYLLHITQFLNNRNTWAIVLRVQIQFHGWLSHFIHKEMAKYLTIWQIYTISTEKQQQTRVL